MLDGRLIVEAAAVGADTQFAGMVRLVEQAQAQKADAQRLADRISSVFVPAVLVIAALTAAGWLIAGDNPTVPSRPHSPCLSSPARVPWGWRLRPR